MCGIVGILDFRGLEQSAAVALTAAMGEAIRHRGPDDHGEWCDAEAGVVLGHRRLSINDLSEHGHQPMVSASGRYVIVLNGEIYNFLELREECEAAGYPFRGHSDTEVALAMIERHGFAAALAHFVGMFAFAVWDREQRCLRVARDRVGEKPLYYGEVAGQFVFASDLNALRRLPGWSPRIDPDALGLMMQHFYVPAPRTIYANLRKLRPARWLEVRFGSGSFEYEEHSYWAPDQAVADRRAALDEQTAIEELDSLLRRTIRDKMIADVPLGAFLSGGIDSSTVVALMQAESASAVRTFSIGFAERGYNEAEDAKRVAEHLGTEHTELYVTPEQTLDVIPRLPALYSEPFADSSQIPTYLVSQLARRDVTVALSGDGGDELFGGYNRYVLAESLWRRLAKMPRGLRHLGGAAAGLVSPGQVDAVMRCLKPLLPTSLRYKQYGDKFHKLATMCRADDEMGVYRMLVSMWSRPSQVVVGCGDVDLVGETLDEVPRGLNSTERMMLLDLLTYLPNDILVKVDRASMGESLEVRVPFLDHRVIEHAWRLPFDVKVRGGEGKWLLKQVLYRYVPKAMVDRPKMGFAVPVAEWLRGPLRDWGGDLLNEQRLRNDGYFRADEVRRTWDEHATGRVDWSPLLWPILMFQAWLDCYERKP